MIKFIRNHIGTFYALILFFIAICCLTGSGRQSIYSAETNKEDAFISGPSENQPSGLTSEGFTSELQRITASDGTPSSYFGGSIAVSGNTAVIGANGTNQFQGAVYVFVRNGNTWIQQAKLTASDGVTSDGFGASVAIDGDTIVTGALRLSSGIGAAYVFTRTGNVWSEQAKLMAPEAGSFFGYSVAVFGDKLFVGAPHKDQSAGGVYPYIRTGNLWAVQPVLTASNGSPDDRFGDGLAFDGQTLAISAPFDDVLSNTNQGSVYAFIQSGNFWVEQSNLSASDGRASDFFGRSLDVEGDKIVVGAPDHDVGTVFNQGAAYLFVRGVNSWAQQSKLTASDGSAGDQFGKVAISNNTIVAGSSGNAVGTQNRRGTGYIFLQDGSEWHEITRLIASDGGPQEGFSSQAIDQNTIFGSSSTKTIFTNANQGQAYYFVKPTSAPDLLESSDTGLSNSDNITSNRNLAFKINGLTSGGTVELLRNNEVVVSATASSNSIFLTDQNAPANGTFRYSAREIVNGQASSLSSIDVTVDTTSPVVTINRPMGQNDSTSANFVNFELTFSEPIPNFGTASVSLAGSTANVSSATVTVTPLSGNHYVNVSNILSDGSIIVNAVPEMSMDAAGNPAVNNIIDNSIIRDTVRPTVTINQAASQMDPTAVLPLVYDVIFSEPVTGFDFQDISFTGSTAPVFPSSSIVNITGSGAVYTVSVANFNSNGQFVRTGILNGAVRDAADNYSLPSTSTDNTVTVDNVKPTVTINQAPEQTDPASIQPLNYRVVFSEPVSGLDQSDILLGNSSADLSDAAIAVTGSGTTYNVAVSNIRTNTVVRASVISDAAQDNLGNSSFASTSTDNTITFVRKRNFFDFDGDGKTDISIFRPSTGVWWINRSSIVSTFAAEFGASTDKLVPGDFTGDGKADMAFWRPSSGFWYILRSEDFSFYGFPFGTSGDVPVAADFDGDGKTDPAVFRASAQGWYIQKSSGGTDFVPFGTTGDTPAVADYDGDGKADVAITRINGANREWWIRRSSNGSVFAAAFGDANDKVAPGDFTGDGKTDITIFRPSTGQWLVLRSEDFSFYGFPFGTNGDIPAPGDYDGDGKWDAAVFRPSVGVWYQLRSTQGFSALQFGTNGDTPIPSVFIP